jgi:membrane associated rhomboid family serine protease
MRKQNLAAIAASFGQTAKGRTFSPPFCFSAQNGSGFDRRPLVPGAAAAYLRGASGAILTEPSEPKAAEPIFNIPATVVATVSVLVLVHAVRAFLLSEWQDVAFVLSFGFIPARYGSEVVLDGSLPGGFGADLWTFFTYAFIHADLMHLGLNLAWLIPFASAVARRFGAWRYALFMLVTAAIGALTHLFTHLGALEPMIGASAAISGAMAAAMRFVFQRDRRQGFFRDPSWASHAPAQPLAMTLRDPRFLLFLATWLGFNALFGSGTISLAGEAQQAIAWQAHVGGFLAGLFLFTAFDPARPSSEFTAEPSI